MLFSLLFLSYLRPFSSFLSAGGDRSSGLNSLKKVDKSQLDKPSALLQEAKGETPAPSVGGGAGMSGQSGSLADALAAALSSRKNRVAHSDDEDDGDW